MLVLENEDSNFETYNVGGGQEISIKNFCRTVAKVFDCEDLPLEIPGQYRFGDTRNAFSDISKIKNIGWKPRNSTEFSVESYYNIKKKKYNHYELNHSYNDGKIPNIRLVDMNNQDNFKYQYGTLSEILIQNIRNSLNYRKQILILQNRKMQVRVC